MDLSSKYLGREKAEEHKKRTNKAAGIQGTVALIGGIILAGLGIALTEGSRSGGAFVVYVGLIWVGADCFLGGIWCLLKRRRFFDISPGVWFLLTMAGLAVAVAFGAAQM